MTAPLKLLLVEDSAVDAERLCAELGRRGYPVSCTRVDTEAALVEALRTGTWDAILGDCRLPGFAGVRALTLCMEHGVTAPFIFISGASEEARRRDGKRLGGCDYFSKADIAALEPVLRSALAGTEGKSRRD
jgi:DNA-binding response OmpR family regulator